MNSGSGTDLNKRAYDALRVLVIDDQAFVRDIVSRMLGQMGVGVIETASDGEEGIKKIDALQPHVVLCDIEMEPVDGITMLQTLRERPSHQVPPVIFLTSHSESDLVRRAKEAGVDAFLLKPVPPQKLRERIDAVLDR